MIGKIVHYIKDDKLRIKYFDGNLNVDNYDKILEVKDDIISFTKDNSIILIRGENLRLAKLLDDEVLITGIITKIEL